MTRSSEGALRLVERDEELARLGRVLAAARSGAGATLVIEGSAGIGKTSLLARLRERAAGSGMTVLHARGTPLEREYAMGVVRQCLDPALRGDADHEALFSGAARLARGVVLDVPDDLETAPVGVLHGLYWLTANLADRAPLLLAIDDAHWADEPSLRFLAYLARRVDSLAVALVICARAGEGTAGAGALAEIRDDADSEVLQPRSLGVAGVEAFLGEFGGGAVESAFVRACHEASGGNPFLLCELVRALRADGIPFTAAGAEQVREVTPPTVARTVRATLDRLGPAARALAHATAVLGEDVELDLAAGLAEISLREATLTAEGLARAGLLDDSARLRFRHPMLTGAVRADLAAPARAAAHRRAADLLKARGSGVERVALQLMHASPSGDVDVAAELRVAAAVARGRGAPATAVALLRRALAEPPAAGARAELLLELGRVEFAVGETGEAAAHLEQAHRCALDAETRGRALIELFQASRGGMESRRTLTSLIEQTLLEVRDRDRELALRLAAIKTVLTSRSPCDADAVGDDARELTGSTPGEAALLGHLTFVRMRSQNSAAQVASIAELAARQIDALLEEGAMSLVMTGIVLPLRWASRGSRAPTGRAVTVARRRGSTTDFANALTQRSSVHRRAWRLLEAESRRA